MGPISHTGPKTSRAARDRPELKPRRNQTSRHDIAGDWPERRPAGGRHLEFTRAARAHAGARPCNKLCATSLDNGRTACSNGAPWSSSSGARWRLELRPLRATREATPCGQLTASARRLGHRLAKERRKTSTPSGSLHRATYRQSSNHRLHIACGHRATIAPAHALMRLRERRRRAQRRPDG
ncbi:hypothetical protein F511_10414 [Dorcoceras hygrometricum]|uniref:Uncharacterized protein n=1 Tax=Dorcoceras hygrometricum TaxID=472368 RepID=A0A2Z7AUI0_9LAMI|nr:hypothetical protein F511_10414 [Dorcoceras hygrometricum]